MTSVPLPSTSLGGGPALDAGAALSAWNPEPVLVLALAVTATVYVRGWLRLRARDAERLPPWRLAAFLGGLATLFVALASPLDTFADRLLAVHMAQHIVLLVVTPPLLLLGAPIGPLLQAVTSKRVRRAVGTTLVRLVDRLGHPVVGFVTMSGAVWGWHVPAAFELALRSEAWHVTEHASFLGAGLLFWWPIVQPWPSRARWPRWAMIPYLLLSDVQNTALAAILTFSDRVLYPTYARGPGALDDQILAGVLMWVMGLAYLVPAGIIAMRLLAPRSRRPDVPGSFAVRGSGGGAISRRPDRVTEEPW